MVILSLPCVLHALQTLFVNSSPPNEHTETYSSRSQTSATVLQSHCPRSQTFPRWNVLCTAYFFYLFCCKILVPDATLQSGAEKMPMCSRLHGGSKNTSHISHIVQRKQLIGRVIFFRSLCTLYEGSVGAK